MVKTVFGEDDTFVDKFPKSQYYITMNIHP